MFTAQEIAEFRADAESRMGAVNGASDVAVMRLTGETTEDVDGFEVPEWAAVYIGPHRLGGSDRGGAGSRTVRKGEVDVALAARVSSFPSHVDVLDDDDLIEIFAGENAGLVLRIVEATWQDQSTARRVPVAEVARPKEWA